VEKRWLRFEVEDAHAETDWPKQSEIK
jgi:hypothetical protein